MRATPAATTTEPARIILFIICFAPNSLRGSSHPGRAWPRTPRPAKRAAAPLCPRATEVPLSDWSTCARFRGLPPRGSRRLRGAGSQDPRPPQRSPEDGARRTTRRSLGGVPPHARAIQRGAARPDARRAPARRDRCEAARRGAAPTRLFRSRPRSTSSTLTALGGRPPPARLATRDGRLARGPESRPTSQARHVRNAPRRKGRTSSTYMVNLPPRPEVGRTIVHRADGFQPAMRTAMTKVDAAIAAGLRDLPHR